MRRSLAVVDTVMIDNSPLIIALDFPNAKLTNAFLDRIQGQTCKLKIGLELFIAEGPRFVEKLVDDGYDVFLDLKLHDIPNTIASACKSASRLGVWMMTLHASGGIKMLDAARNSISAENYKTKLVAVTMLTSLDQEQIQAMGVQQSPQDYVLLLVSIAQQANMDGIVCSAHEAHAVRKKLGESPIIVTPGIRLAPMIIVNDQSRVSDPQQARQSGSSYIVVGRPITQAQDPVFTINQYLTNWNSSNS